MLNDLFTVLLSSVALGGVSYMIVWGVHNFEITVNAIMSWADKQESFLQKLISCPLCFGTQVAVATSSLHCLAFSLGLWRWVLITCLTVLCTLLLVHKLKPLDEEHE